MLHIFQLKEPVIIDSYLGCWQVSCGVTIMKCWNFLNNSFTDQTNKFVKVVKGGPNSKFPKNPYGSKCALCLIAYDDDTIRTCDLCISFLSNNKTWFSVPWTSRLKKCWIKKSKITCYFLLQNILLQSTFKSMPYMNSTQLYKALSKGMKQYLSLVFKLYSLYI